MGLDRTDEAIRTMSEEDPAQIQSIRRQYHVHIVADTSRTERVHQAKLALNLLTRMFQKVTVEGVDPRKDLGLPDWILRNVRQGRQFRDPADVILSFSHRQVRTDPQKVVYIDNRGWATYLSSETPSDAPTGEENPLGALYAAAQGVGEAFNRAFGDLIEGTAPLEGTQKYDLVSGTQECDARFEPSLAEADPLRTDHLLVGAGAVGQAFILALAALPGLSGRVEVLDHENVDADNLDRYVLATPQTINSPKTEVAKRTLAESFPLLDISTNVPPPIEPTTWNTRFGMITRHGPSAATPGFPTTEIRASPMLPRTEYGVWRRYNGSEPRPLVVCAVDSSKARRDIQFGMHEVILNGWTHTADAEMSFGIGRYEIGSAPCMACEYHETLDGPPDPVDVYTEMTGLDRSRVVELLEDPSESPTEEEIIAIADHRNLDRGPLLQRAGQSLSSLIQAVCGAARLQDNDRQGVSPVAHIPVFVGIQLAVQVVLEALGETDDRPKVIQGDARREPGIAGERPPGEPEPHCLCQEPRVQEYYGRLWSE